MGSKKLRSWILQAQNFLILTKIAPKYTQNEKYPELGLKGKRLKGGWKNQYMENS